MQCSFHLINVLFLDNFVADFANIGNIATRQMLDTGKAANDKHFWERVRSTFITADPEYDKLRFSDDEVLENLQPIDSSQIVAHEWQKVRSMWKVVNAVYKGAISRFTQSGTHDSNFFDFCDGKADVNYLQKNSELRPCLNDMIEADLPD